MALVSSAMPRAVWPFHGSPGGAPASLGRPTWPRPWRFLKAALAFDGSNRPWASSSVWPFCCHTHIIWAAFSSRVIRQSKSLTRAVGESERFLYGGATVFFPEWTRGRWLMNRRLQGESAQGDDVIGSSFSGSELRCLAPYRLEPGPRGSSR